MTASDTESGAIFVLPTTTSAQQGPVAGWVSTSGWAAAAARVLGRSWVVTPGGVLDPAEVRRRASSVSAPAATSVRWRRRIPTMPKTALKDVRSAVRGRRLRAPLDGPWTSSGVDVELVWQRHELFATAGLDLADALGVPSVLFVPATLVWQAEQWGVHRPWGALLERAGEAPALRRADVVACGTDIVAEQAVRLGADPGRVLLTPTGVDLDAFADRSGADAVRRSVAPDGTVVVGWVGSFRPYHRIPDLIEAVAPLPDVALLLVGDGPERAAAERLAADRGVRAVFPGVVGHEHLPSYLGAMDLGVVLLPPGPTHYSPLKLAEYLAAGLPVIAPDVPQIAERVDDAVVLYPPGDVGALRAAIEGLAADPAHRAQMAAAARLAAVGWSWDEQVERIRAAAARVRLS